VSGSASSECAKRGGSLNRENAGPSIARSGYPTSGSPTNTNSRLRMLRKKIALPDHATLAPQTVFEGQRLDWSVLGASDSCRDRLQNRQSNVRPDLPTRGTSQHQPVAVLRSGAISIDYFRGFSFADLRRRTPGPPPFSSMNSTPAASRARRMASSFAAVSEVAPSATSALRIVLAPNAASLARSAALHRSSARAARIWAAESAPVFIRQKFPYGLN
jgi:hypothetical protein